jgi:hypothetical protein
MNIKSLIENDIHSGSRSVVYHKPQTVDVGQANTPVT